MLLLLASFILLPLSYMQLKNTVQERKKKSNGANTWIEISKNIKNMSLKSAIALMMVMAVMMEVATAQSTTEECRSTIAAMQGCLPYASGKVATPTADCCKVVNTTVQHNKDCLCQFIALVHQGSPEIVQLGVKEDKLVQLPSACNLKNVSASNCPKLSPTSAPSMNTTSTGGGYKQQQQLLGFPIQALLLLAMMAILLPFPDGFLRF